MLRYHRRFRQGQFTGALRRHITPSHADLKSATSRNVLSIGGAFLPVMTSRHCTFVYPRFELTHCIHPHVYRGTSGCRTPRPHEMKALCSFETSVTDCLVRGHGCKNLQMDRLLCLVRGHGCKNLQMDKLLVVCCNNSGPS
jgi:hypothetical protein